VPEVKIRDLNDEDFNTVIEGSAVPVLVDFWAKWCTPCKTLLPVLDELSEEYGSKVSIAKINVDDAPKTAGHYKIMSIPTLILFKDGKVFEQAVGMRPKSFLQRWLKAALK